MVWLLLFLLALSAETAYCFLHPIAYFDTFSYVSLSRPTPAINDFASIGQSCGQTVPGAYSGCHEILASEVFQQAAALAPADYHQFLRFYTVKPLYNGLVRAIPARNPFLALRILSAGSFACIGLLIVFWMRQAVPPALASVAALCLVSLPGVLGLGRALLPDGLLTALLLLGACLLVFGRTWIGAAALVAATLVRPDALLFAACCGVIFLWQAGTARTRMRRLGLLAACTISWTLILGRSTGALPWRVLFVHSFIAWTPPAQYLSLHVSLRDYLRVLSSNGVRTVLFCLPLPGLLATLALAGRSTPRMRQAIRAALAAVLLRILLYPGVEDRYYVWLTILAAIGAVFALANPKTPRRPQSASPEEPPLA